MFDIRIFWIDLKICSRAWSKLVTLTPHPQDNKIELANTKTELLTTRSDLDKVLLQLTNLKTSQEKVVSYRTVFGQLVDGDLLKVDCIMPALYFRQILF